MGRKPATSGRTENIFCKFCDAPLDQPNTRGLCAGTECYYGWVQWLKAEIDNIPATT